MSALTPGTRIGSYEVLSSLGAGGMGEVYRARDSKLKRDVALKVLPADVAGDRERLARFQREAEVLAALNHPNIAHVYGLEESALVMELVEGEDLSQRIARGATPIDDALAIAKQIADALEAAHEAGIVHRDLKPANVKVRPDGTVKVLDFGLAKALDTGATGAAGAAGATGLANSPTITSPAMTVHGMILGTAAYMSPEQAKGRPVDKRTDIWAFGCVLYEMLTGKRAYDGEDVTDTIAAVVSRDPDWSRLPASTPAGVRRLLVRCLTKDRKRRLRDIGDAHYEFAEDAPAGVSPPPPPAGRAPWVVTAAAAVVAALLAIPAISHFRETVASPPALRLTIDAPANSIRLLSPEISPDGRAVAFGSIASGALGPQLWIRRLDEPAPILAPGPIAPTGPPFWSPDGSAMAVMTRNGLVHLDLATGGTRALGAARSTMVGESQFSGTWSRDGVLLYGMGSMLFRVSEGGGDTARVTLDGLAPDADVRFPVFLPDGRRFLFMARQTGESYLYAGSLDGGPVTRLFPSDSQGIYTEPVPGRGHVLYVRDENLMAQPFDLATLTSTGAPWVVASGVPLFTAEFIGTGRAAFTASPDGVLVYTNRSEALLQRLVWINREGEEVGTIGEPALYFGPRISPDGTRVAVARLDNRSRLGDIYVLAEGGASQRLTFDEANDLQPVWTPDGQSIIWGSQRGATSMLVRKRADGTGAEEILHRSEHPLAPDDVSSDGRYVVFRASTTETRNDLWVLPLDGSGKARPLLNTPADEPRARFSPDGRLIGYISDASGRVEGYLQPFPDMNGKWQVTDRGGQVPQWRRDGREVYYTSGSTVWARPVLSLNPPQLGQAVALFTPPATPRGSFFHAAADGQRFLFAPERFSSESLRFHIAVGWMKP